MSNIGPVGHGGSRTWTDARTTGTRNGSKMQRHWAGHVRKNCAGRNAFSTSKLQLVLLLLTVCTACVQVVSGLSDETRCLFPQRLHPIKSRCLGTSKLQQHSTTDDAFQTLVGFVPLQVSAGLELRRSGIPATAACQRSSATTIFRQVLHRPAVRRAAGDLSLRMQMPEDKTGDKEKGTNAIRDESDSAGRGDAEGRFNIPITSWVMVALLLMTNIHQHGA